MKTADKAARQRGQDTGFAASSATMEDYRLKSGRRRPWAPIRPFLPGAGPTVAPVKVYAPDGTLKEVVPAEEWRRRHGDPFRQRREEED